MGNLLRYPDEVHDENEYYDDIRDVKITKDMPDLAQHIGICWVSRQDDPAR